MTDKQPAGYYLLIGLSLLLSVLAALTLLPRAAASKPNVLGYRSVCTFAPAATALCGLLAALTCTLRNRLVSSRRASTRFQPPIIPALVGVALVVTAVVSGASFARAQTRFYAVIEGAEVAGGGFGSLADGRRVARVREGEVEATVELTVTGGRVSAISLGSGKNVGNAVADAIFRAVMSSQSTDVDAVSGATASSRVLLAAIEAAARGRQ